MGLKGRVYDPETKRWYRDGYAPFQLPEVIEATCLWCGLDTLRITKDGATCGYCDALRNAELAGAYYPDGTAV